MKKIIKYSFAALSAAFVLASCDDNKPTVFDDSNAFVAFSAATYSVDEDDDSVCKIPVLLASKAGLTETVSYSISYPESKAAKAGVNFELLSTTGTLSFSETQRVDTIRFKAKYFDEYTGDLSFTINLDQPKNVNLGYMKTCTVKVCDVDHPLSAMLGKYTMSGSSYWNGPSTWTITILKDADDDHKVWINNLADVGTSEDLNMYGNVNDDMTKLFIPLGQATEYIHTYGEPLYLYGLDNDFNDYDNGNLEVDIIKNAAGVVTGLDFGTEMGMWVMSFKEAAHENNLNFAIILPGITGEKN